MYYSLHPALGYLVRGPGWLTSGVVWGISILHYTTHTVLMHYTTLHYTTLHYIESHFISYRLNDTGVDELTVPDLSSSYTIRYPRVSSIL